MLTALRLKFEAKHVKVVHRSEEGCTATHLSSLPRSMLLTFSGYFRAGWDLMSEMDKGQLAAGSRNMIVSGCEYGAVSGIFDMVKWWCDGVRTVPDYPKERLFIDMYRLHDAAKMLRVPNAMLDVIEDRLDEIEESWFPEIKELVAVYADFPNDHCARRHTLKSWTTAYLEGETDVEEDIGELFEDHAELLRDVDDTIAAMQEQRYVKRYQDEEMNNGEVEREPATAVEAGTGGWKGFQLPLR